MQTPKKQVDGLLEVIASDLRGEFALKKRGRTFYRYVGDLVQCVAFSASSWNSSGDISFTGDYLIGHVFESRLYQNTDGPLDPTRIASFESEQIARWRIHSDEEIGAVAAQVLADIRQVVLPAFAACSPNLDYLSALRVHPSSGDGDRLRQIKMRIYSGDFAAVRREVDAILEKESFTSDDVWLRAQVRLLYPYLERKELNQTPEPTAPSGRGSS